MSLVITGATGHLGRLVVADLLERGVPGDEILATGRREEALAELAASGVRTAVTDYARPETLVEAFAGAEVVLLISSSEVGQRLAQHEAVIAAAQQAGVASIVYTSIAHADTSGLTLAVEHLGTERLLAKSGLEVTLLRNGWYLENYTAQVGVQLEHGVIGASGEGRISAATRADFAAAAAAVLTDAGLRGRTYELGGDTAFTMADYAAWVSEASGRSVAYTDLGQAGYAEALESAGVPAPFAEILADSDAGAARGELEVTGGALSKLIGRPTTAPVDAIRAAL